MQIVLTFEKVILMQFELRLLKLYDIRVKFLFGGRVGVFGIATRLWGGRFGFRIPAGTRDFSLLQKIQTAFGSHPAFCSIGTGLLSRGVNRLGREVYQSSLCSAEVKNKWSCVFIPLYTFVVWIEIDF